MSPRPSNFDELLKRMRSRDPQVQEDAFHTVLDQLDHYKDDVLAATLNETEDEGVLSWLLELLSHTQDPAIVPNIARFLQDPRERVRASAKAWLASMNVREARIALWNVEHRR